MEDLGRTAFHSLLFQVFRNVDDDAHGATNFLRRRIPLNRVAARM